MTARLARPLRPTGVEALVTLLRETYPEGIDDLTREQLVDALTVAGDQRTPRNPGRCTTCRPTRLPVPRGDATPP